MKYTVNPQMRMLILLAVFWAAGSFLLAAESPSTPKPAATAEQTEGEVAKADKKPDATAGKKSEGDGKGEAQAAAQTDSKTDTKSDAKAGTKEAGKGSIAEQAEAALKAAAEADPGSSTPKDAPKSDDPAAQDDTQLPPTVAAKGPSPQRFVPTEQVRADFDVSFPIDI